MPALQVRDFPQDLYDELKECAATEHRSLAQQTVHAVEEMLTRRRSTGCTEAPVTIRFDSPGARQERVAKRQALFSRIERHAAKLPKDLPSPEAIMRESRAEHDSKDEDLLTLVGGCGR